MATDASKSVGQDIEDVVQAYPSGVTARQIARELSAELPFQVLRYQLQQLVKDGQLIKTGKTRGTRYQLATTVAARTTSATRHAIESVVRGYPNGARAQQIAHKLGAELPFQELRYQLQQLVKDGQLIKTGKTRGTRYQLATVARRATRISREPTARAGTEAIVPLSERSCKIQRHLRQPKAKRRPVAYDRGFLDDYRPNTTPYLSAKERELLANTSQLSGVGHTSPLQPPIMTQSTQQLELLATTQPAPATAYALDLPRRFLIDLAWNSSRLEGNTYSLLDTRHLVEFNQTAKGQDPSNTQMILNHREAIRFLLDTTGEIGCNRSTLQNLHAILANNLLPHGAAGGQLRRIPVGIEKSVFLPLAVPQQIEECFELLLANAAAISDPFEQALFLLVQLPYLQPFDDVNKRCSRLAANIPLLKANLAPLSFIDVPRDTYIDALLGVYELQQIDLIKEVFIWAYKRSAEDYATVRQSLGEPDPFRQQYREALRTLVGELVRSCIGREQVPAYITAWARRKNIAPTARTQFSDTVKSELLTLHEGNYARHKIRSTEFTAWREMWGP